MSDDDVLYDHESLLSLYTATQKHNKDIAYGLREYIDSQGHPHHNMQDMNISTLKGQPRRSVTFKEQLLDHSMWFGGILYKNYRQHFNRYVEETADYDFNLRYLSQHDSCVVINKKTFKYRIHTTQLSSTVSLKKAIKLYTTML